VANYLSTDLDCKTAIEAVKFTRSIMQTDAMKDHIAEEMLPDPKATSDEQLLDQARNIANTIYHPTSTCRMGADENAVVDPRLRVRGVGGLRVVDASIMPEIVSGNTNAPTIMIAERASDLICRAFAGMLIMSMALLCSTAVANKSAYIVLQSTTSTQNWAPGKPFAMPPMVMAMFCWCMPGKPRRLS